MRGTQNQISIVIWLTFFLAGLPSIFFGQFSNDSLLATFRSIDNDSIRIDSMFKVANELAYADPSQGIWLSEQAEADPWSLGNLRIRANGLNMRGSIYYLLKINDLAMLNFMESLKISDSADYELGRAHAWDNIGTIQENQNQYEEALESYRNARSTYLKLGRRKHAFRTLANIALIYQDLKQYDKAIEICDSVLLEIEDPNDALGYGMAYHVLGHIYQDKEDYPQALNYFNLAIEKYDKLDDKISQAELLIDRALVKNEMKMNDEALENANLALQIAQEFGAKPSIVLCYNTLAEIYKDRGDARLALEWMEKSKALSDSLQSEENETDLANYQALYEVNQKDAEIDLLSKDKEIQAAKLINVWYLFGLVSVVLLAMVSVVVILVRNNKARRRINLELQGKNEQILAQHEQISQQNAALTDHNEQLNNLNHEMSGLLHVVAHDLKAPLNQVTGLLSVVEEEGNLNPTQEKMLSMAKKVTNNAGNLVKDLVELGSAEQQAAQLQKVPVPLTALVAEVAAAFSAEAARKSIEIHTALPEDEALCMTESYQMRRVLENLLSNALKFSPSGKTVQISLTQSAGVHRIAIQDQGPGISAADQKNLYRKFHKLSARPTGGESSSGLGLAIVKSLVEQLGGEIALTSEVGLGSTFVVSIPANEK